MYATTYLILGLIAILAISGVHVAFAFAIASVIGLAYTLGGFIPALELMQQTALNEMNSYSLVVLPLFAVMGLVISNSGAASDLFHVVNRAMRALPGRLAVATVGGNAIFAAVTGVGAAAVVAFSRIAYPEMKKNGYADSFSTGVIAGSAVLGLLIPPSVFMIIFAILTEQSVGKLFAAGVGPGLLLALFFGIYCVVAARFVPGLVPAQTTDGATAALPERPGAGLGAISVGILIIVTLGGIWGGYLTPTEGAAVGLFGSALVAFIKGLKLKEVFDAFLDAGEAITPILMLILGAAMYTKLLALEGVPDLIAFAFEDANLGVVGSMLVFVAIWLLLGCLIDSISIMLLTVPIFWPIANGLGIDPIVFALIGILAIEAGVLTPPFGIAVFIVKSSIPNPDVPLGQIFWGVTPYWFLIVVVALVIWFVPALATWLPANL